MGGSFIFGDSFRFTNFTRYSLAKICVPSLAHLLPALPLGTKWRLS